MKIRATRDAKMSLVNLLKYFTSTDPWNPATTRAMRTTQKEVHTLQGRNSISLLLAKPNSASSNRRRGPVHPE